MFGIFCSVGSKTASTLGTTGMRAEQTMEQTMEQTTEQRIRGGFLTEKHTPGNKTRNSVATCNFWLPPGVSVKTTPFSSLSNLCTASFLFSPKLSFTKTNGGGCARQVTLNLRATENFVRNNKKTPTSLGGRRIANKIF